VSVAKVVGKHCAFLQRRRTYVSGLIDSLGVLMQLWLFCFLQMIRWFCPLSLCRFLKPRTTIFLRVVDYTRAFRFFQCQIEKARSIVRPFKCFFSMNLFV
jgi:hypothetical protein